MAEAWRGFKKDGHWDVDVNVRNFIQTNYTPYDGDESFLEGSTEATDKLWGRLQELSLIHISEPTRLPVRSRMPSSA